MSPDCDQRQTTDADQGSATDFDRQKAAYADLIVQFGVNLQPGQALHIKAELAQRAFVRLLAEKAYRAGARFVEVEWEDPLLTRGRLQYSQEQYLSFVPEYEVAQAQEMLDTDWVIVRVSGTEYPDVFDDVDATAMRQVQTAAAQKLEFWRSGLMQNRMAWCVCAAPTVAWAQKVFPELEAEAARQQLWQVLLAVTRADQPDPLQAWRQHDKKLKKVVRFMDDGRIRSLRFLDETPGPDGRPNTDLTIGLTDRPKWLSGSATTPNGNSFFPNIPTEETFSTPHNGRAEGWVRTSKPGFPFEREVRDAYFRFEDGEMVEFRAAQGEDALAQFFEMEGARRLGEVALVDVNSPIYRSGLVFHNTLFDENAASHIAFGRAYPGGVAGGDDMAADELAGLGVNDSLVHQDFMIGTPTMRLIGIRADGSQVTIMEDGCFTAAVLT